MSELVLCMIVTALLYYLILCLPGSGSKPPVLMVRGNRERLEWELHRAHEKAQRIVAVSNGDEELDQMLKIWLREKKLFDVIDRN